MKHKGENLETYPSLEDAPSDGEKMLADPLLNKAFLQPSYDQISNKQLKRQEERLGFQDRMVGSKGKRPNRRDKAFKYGGNPKHYGLRLLQLPC